MKLSFSPLEQDLYVFLPQQQVIVFLLSSYLYEYLCERTGITFSIVGLSPVPKDIAEKEKSLVL